MTSRLTSLKNSLPLLSFFCTFCVKFSKTMGRFQMQTLFLQIITNTLTSLFSLTTIIIIIIIIIIA